MRDKKWVAEHRGGALKIEQHKQLMKWALDMADHSMGVVYLTELVLDGLINKKIVKEIADT